MVAHVGEVIADLVVVGDGEGQFDCVLVERNDFEVVNDQNDFYVLA